LQTCAHGDVVIVIVEIDVRHGEAELILLAGVESNPVGLARPVSLTSHIPAMFSSLSSLEQ
jgi:hypothetical protein